MKQTINLLPYHATPPRDWLSFNSVAAMLAAGVAAMVMAGSWLEWRYAEEAAVLAEQKQQTERLQQEAQALEAAFARRNDNPAIIQQQQRLENQLAMKQRLVQAIEQLHTRRNDGFSGYLQALASADRPQIWLTHILVNTADEQLSLSGRTLQPAAVPELLGSLARQPQLQGFGFAELSLETAAQGTHAFTAQGARYSATGGTQ